MPSTLRFLLAAAVLQAAITTRLPRERSLGPAAFVLPLHPLASGRGCDLCLTPLARRGPAAHLLDTWTALRSTHGQGDYAESDDRGRRSRETWTVRRGDHVRQIPASGLYARDGGLMLESNGGRSKATREGMGGPDSAPKRQRRVQNGRRSDAPRGRQARRGRGGRDLKRGALPLQIKLNQRLAACSSAAEVFQEVDSARAEAIPLNSVNLATALHRVARCGNADVFRNLADIPTYNFLVHEVSVRLESNDSDFKPREIANAAWGLAKAQVAVPEVFASLCSAALAVGLHAFKPQELSICAWACSTCYNQCDSRQRTALAETISTFFASVEGEIVARSRRRGGHMVAEEGRGVTRAHSKPVDAIHSKAINARESHDKASGAGAGLRDFKPQELSNTLWSFATVDAGHREVFAVIEEEMLERGLREHVPQDIANSVWAFVTAGISTPAVLQLVEQEVQQRGVACFKSQELANLVWAFAKADKSSYDMNAFAILVEADLMQRDLRMFMPQELSNIVWAYATAGTKSERLFNAIEAEILQRGLGRFKSQEMANVAWGFAKSQHDAPRLFDSIQTELLTARQLQQFIPQELSNLLWSYAKLGYASTSLFRSLSGEMLRRGLSTFKTQELSNAVWAHATTGLGSDRLFVAVEEEALSRGLKAFSPQDLANMVWAFGKADHVAVLLFENMKAEFDVIRDECGSLDLFKAQELSNLLWACAKTQHTAKMLFEQAEADARVVLDCMHKSESKIDGAAQSDEWVPAPGLSPGASPLSMPPLEVSGELWRYARVGQCADGMFEKLEEEILTRDFAEFSTQHFANIAWSYVFLKFSRFNQISTSGNRLLAAVLIAAEARLAQFTLEELRQLGQVLLATRQRGNREVGLAKKVQERLRREHLTLAAPASSDFHLHVSEMLEQMGVVHHNEVKVFEGVYHIDIVVGEGAPSQTHGKIAIEVDGPTHFVPNSTTPTPHTALKRWLLEREGYIVISVPFFEWGPLQGDGVMQAYLEMKLNEVGWDLDLGRLRDGTMHGRSHAWTV